MSIKIKTWFFFTVIAGILPIGLIIIVCSITNMDITYNMLQAEIFFFNLMILSDAIKELYFIKDERNNKIFLFSTILFCIIIISFIYGILMVNTYKCNLDININIIQITSISLTVLCFIISFCIQIMGGKNVKCN